MSCSLVSPEFNPLHALKFLDSLELSGKKSRQPLVIKCNNNPQNVDLPRYYSKKEKKPFPVPIVELRRAARERMKSRKGQPKRVAPPPPKNGLLVQSMIPLAYAVLNARTKLINNLKKLLKVVSVQAYKYCNEIHVGPVGHPFRSCQGQNLSIRKGKHEWVDAVVEDIIVQIKAYRLYDRLGKHISHEERFSVPRIPALVELCIQAGVELPKYPTKRRRNPIIRINKSEFIDVDESELPDPTPESPIPKLLTELQDWENCGAYKHQQRNGQHRWQAAVLDDLIPPRYVWHVLNVAEPLLQKELRNFYGQATAVVEICIQGGAAVPEEYKGTMRLDVGIPSSVREAEMVV
ncbi:hypothetical protein L2E82_22457 [Cichorium intybus]|uniref:Uncharacterized protein n=1 Tax=Cichorium intybus TaxID=13427 RepID=A0ACB9DXF8_CICIN|nr:hypothetical protein L2E82_22457 [Cichorium intybus]